MEYRELGRTGWKVSEVSFGAWAIGGTWGPVDDTESLKAMHTAVDLGVNFFDTADVYGDGRSERLLRQLRHERPGEIKIATKAGRRLNPHTADGYTAENLSAFIDRSLANLGVESLDLLQLHCPPTDVFYRPEVFDALDAFVKAGKIQFYGVSVERAEEALKAMEYPGVQTVQIVLNIFRQRPLGLVLREAQAKRVGVLARLPLSSGMLTGKMSLHSKFDDDDHRSFNRDGAAFDKGETFSGVPFEVGLAAVERLRNLVPSGLSMTQLALKWILMHDGVSCAIPGAKNVRQASENFNISELPDLDTGTMSCITQIYAAEIAPYVHQRW